MSSGSAEVGELDNPILVVLQPRGLERVALGFPWRFADLAPVEVWVYGPGGRPFFEREVELDRAVVELLAHEVTYQRVLVRVEPVLPRVDLREARGDGPITIDHMPDLVVVLVDHILEPVVEGLHENLGVGRVYEGHR